MLKQEGLKRLLVGIGTVALIAACTGAKPAEETKAATATEAHESPATEGSSAAAAKYACPMHPEETSDHDGAKCSKCGMNLVAGGEHSGH